jgi:hypothetical protein
MRLGDKIIIIVGAIVILLLLMGCSTLTENQKQWNDPNLEKRLALAIDNQG